MTGRSSRSPGHRPPGTTGGGPGPVLAVGMVPPGASGVRDYGRLLAAELRREGRPVDEAWVVNDGRRLGPAVAASARLLGAALTRRPPRLVIWHYSCFAHGLRGFPMPGVLLGLAFRSRGTRVVTVLHEPAYPWGPRGLRGRLQSGAQWMALPLVLLGSAEAVVTTERRAVALRRLPHAVRPCVRTVPVFSTVEVAGAPGPPPGEDGLCLGLLGYSGDGARPDLLVRALVAMEVESRPRVLVLGSPGPLSPEGRGLRSLADDLGVGHLLSFSGMIPADDLSRRLQSCAVVLVLNEQGPSSRRTTIAVPLAHGLPMICLDGPDRWEPLARERAAVLVKADVGSVTEAVLALLADPDERRRQADRARRCYADHMGVGRVAGAVGALLDGAGTPAP